MGLGKQEQLLVLPDTASGARLAEAACLPVLSAFESGRPFVVGVAYDGRTWCHRSRTGALVAVGSLPQRIPVAFRSLIDRARSVGDINTLFVPGSFALVVRIGAEVRVQGTISGLRKISWCRIAGEAVAATDASILAALTHATPRPRAIDRWLLAPQAPHPLANQSAWTGIEILPAGSFLAISRGVAAIKPYWSPPQPNTGRDDSAECIRERITLAVAVRAAAPLPLTCDASGGMDSSTVLAIAARERDDVAAFTTGPPELFADEMRWAGLVVRASKVRRWITTEPSAFPHVFDDIDEALTVTDEPFAGTCLRNRTRFVASRLAREYPGSRITHLTGHLGDECFAGGIAHLRDLGPRKLAELRRRIDLIHARTRISRRQLWRWALSRAPYASSYRRFTRTGIFPLGWLSHRPELPPWVGAEVRDGFLNSLRGEPTPAQLGNTAEQHETLSRIQASGELLRQESTAMAHHGVFLEVPFGDDQVIDALMRVPVGELQDPTTVKPLLLRAAEGLIPRSITTRTTKTDSTRAIWAGLEKNRQRLKRVTNTMFAADAGLIDEDAFRRALFGPHPPQLSPMSLWRTLAVELWLRDVGGPWASGSRGSRSTDGPVSWWA